MAARLSGKLVLCATPIGNLEDMPPRVVRTIAEADVVACEDTRRTRKLLTHFGIDARELVVFNDVNERRQTEPLVRRMTAGATVALVSDAGMPGLSDPGYHLVRACVEAGVPVGIVPGPSAAISALAVSGLPPARFVFEGFLPRKSGDRRRRLEDVREEPRTLVFYESPHRLAASLADMSDVLGPRDAAVARELTKMFEEVKRGDLAELAEWAGSEAPRGEIVVVVGGAPAAEAQPDARRLAEAARSLMDEGVARKEAMQEVARSAGVSRRAVFDALLESDEG